MSDITKALSPLRSASAVQNAFWLFLITAIPLHAQTNPADAFNLAPPLPLMPPTFWELYHWWVIGGVAILLLLLGILLWIVLKPRPPVVIPPATLARDALGKLAGQTEDGACLSRISQIVRHYYVAAFQLPAREMTTTEITAILTSHESIGSDLSDRVSNFLLECDQRKFTSQPAAASGAVQRALELVNLGESRRTAHSNHLQQR